MRKRLFTFQIFLIEIQQLSQCEPFRAHFRLTDFSLSFFNNTEHIIVVLSDEFTHFSREDMP